MSIDGYLDSATEQRLVLSNDADLDRVDAVRAGCDAILVGAAHRPQRRPAAAGPFAGRARDERLAEGLPPTPMKVTRHRHADARRRAPRSSRPATATSWSTAPAPACAEAAARLGCVATVVDGGQPVDLHWVSEDLVRRGRAAADGRGRRQRAHPVPHRRPRRRTAARGGARVRRRLARPGGSSATARSRGIRAGARPSPRCARSTTWCCCATRCRRGSRRADQGGLRCRTTLRRRRRRSAPR